MQTGPTPAELNFDDTRIAFATRSNGELKKIYWLFQIIASPTLVRINSAITPTLVRTVPFFDKIIKATAFNHFCGGETIEECADAIAKLQTGNVGTILDYSAEGDKDELSFQATFEELKHSIRAAAGRKDIPFAVFKVSGIGNSAALTKKQAGKPMTAEDQAEYDRAKERTYALAALAHEHSVRLFVDAEETWFQKEIDDWALDLMRKFNQKQAIVFNTYQCYTKAALGTLQEHLQLAKAEGFTVGAKLVRGAYMEKEAKAAEEGGYPNPIHNTKANTDADYNAAAKLSLENLDRVAFCLGTHNEESCRRAAAMMEALGIERDHPHVWFAQLLGMSDNLSFVLAKAGYNAAKYVPYGPVKKVMPYLIRRANENTSVAGQSSRELSLVEKEISRRGIRKVF